MTVAVGVLVPLVCALGFWQLDRGAEKRRYQEVLFARMAAPAVAPPDADQLEPFVRIRLEGEFEEERYFLVDNQIAEGKVGYWVVHSFSAADGRRWLVNRGWFPAALRRELLPAVPVPSGRVVTVGVVWPDTGLVPLLAADEWEGSWPERVQRLNVARMARRLENGVAVEIRLEAGQPGVLRPAPLAGGFDAQRHDGYAMQWFALAAVLGIGYLVYGLRRTGPEDGKEQTDERSERQFET